jgi:hypothetical protein
VPQCTYLPPSNSDSVLFSERFDLLHQIRTDLNNLRFDLLDGPTPREGKQRPQWAGFGGAPPQPCPQEHLLEKNGRSGWPAEGLWCYKERQMGLKTDRLGLRGTVRSRQGESKEVGGVGSKRASSSGGQGGGGITSGGVG